MGVWWQEVKAWRRYVEADLSLAEARKALIQCDEPLVSTLRAALSVPEDRGSALRLMNATPYPQWIEVFPDLLDLATTGHSDIGLVRRLLSTLPGGYLDSFLWVEVDRALVAADDEVFRRLAELLSDLGRHDDLRALVALAEASDDADTQEVAADFRRT